MPILHERVDQIQLDHPVLLVCLDGWVDAGVVLPQLVERVTARGARPIVRFDVDALLDHRARRPAVEYDDGHTAALRWPELRLDAVLDDHDRDVLVLHGPEPDYRWRSFATEVADLAAELGVSRVMALGGYPAAVPHTRPVRLTATGTSVALVEVIGALAGSISVPAGAQAAVELACRDRAIPSVNLWAPVPHYAAALPFPAGVLALLDGLEQVGPRRFSAGGLVEAAGEVADRLDVLVAQNREHLELLRRLEQHHDATSVEEIQDPIPSADELAAEVERFLREHDEEG